MPLITYVDDRAKARSWKFGPPMTLLETTDEYLSESQKDAVLIIHGGQKDGHRIAPSGRPYLLEAVVRICARGGRAIVFSGGHSFNSETFRNQLAELGFQEGLHYLLLPAIANLEDEIDVQALLQATVSSSWPISEIKRHHATPMLLTLGLLCQAALLALEPGKVDHDAVELLGGLDAMNALRASCDRASAQRLLTPALWRTVFGVDEQSAVIQAIEKELPEQASAGRGVRTLIDGVFREGAAFRPDVLSQAFVEVHGALGCKQELRH